MPKKDLTIKEIQKAIQFYKKSELYDSAQQSCVSVLKDRMLNREMINQALNLVDMLWNSFQFIPSQTQFVNDELIELGTNIKYITKQSSDYAKLIESLVQACVRRVDRNKYRIFINDYCEPVSYEAVDLHEKGHIKYGHTIHIQAHVDQFKKTLETIWDSKLESYFEKVILKDPKNKDKIIKMLYAEFSNIAQDMEINSKLFGKEWKDAAEIMMRSSLIMRLKYLSTFMDDLSGIVKDDKIRDIDSLEYKSKIAMNFMSVMSQILVRLDKNYDGKDFAYCHPEYKNWPVNLDWMTYMALLVKNFDDTMKKIMESISQAMGETQPGGNGSGQPTPPMSQETFDNYCNKMDAQSAGEGEGEGDDEGDGNSNESESETDVDYKYKGRSQGGKGRDKQGSGEPIEFELCSSIADFSKILKKNCLGKKALRLNTNVLYYSNRKKMSSNVVTPRRHYIDKWVPVRIIFIIDVSGSVPSSFVERIVETITENNAGIDLKTSRIIFCDTKVVLDEIMGKRSRSVYAGGGTEISEGIKYASKYMHKATDKIFIISDLQDSLETWLKESKKFPGQKFVVGYGSKEESNNLKKRKTGFGAEWNAEFQTIFIDMSSDSDNNGDN